MKTENKTSPSVKTKSPGYRQREAFDVPNKEPGKHYCWARKTQVEGTDISPLPDGWTPVNRRMSNTGVEGDQRGTDGKVLQGDLVLCEISDEDYARNSAAKRELAKGRINMVTMKPTKNRYYTVESELKQEVVNVTKNDN